jgi:putative ABC transport system substrate-binding protein
MPIVGRLSTGSVGPNDPVEQTLRAGLRELGYAEGRDYKFEYRNAAGRPEELPRLAEELARLPVDVIVTGTEAATQAAKQATKTIPIVAILPDHDPVATGLIESLNRPGGNVTGLTVRNSQLAPKRLELLKEILPGLSRVTVVSDAFVHPEADALRPAARSLGINLELIELEEPYNFDAAFARAKKHKAGAIMLLSSPVVYSRRFQLGALALNQRLPCDAVFHDVTRVGGLMSYSTDVMAGFHRSAYYIDRILKGVKPADLPFEQTADVKLLVNLRTAKALGIDVPESVLLRADEALR